MPTINYHRTWCKTCNDWTLHHSGFGSDTSSCKVCKTEWTEITLGEIPKEKIIEQRERYNEGKKKSGGVLGSYFAAAFGDSGGLDMRPPGSDVKITEEDAGQKAINDAREKRIHEQWKRDKQAREELKEEYTFYSSLGRNDICLCGSGKKYKKCCLKKFENI